MSGHFTADTFAFLRDLKRHNTREWFAANRDRYVEFVEAPMLRFIVVVGERLPSISASYVANARRMGGSMYRPRNHRPLTQRPQHQPPATQVQSRL